MIERMSILCDNILIQNSMNMIHQLKLKDISGSRTDTPCTK